MRSSLEVLAVALYEQEMSAPVLYVNGYVVQPQPGFMTLTPSDTAEWRTPRLEAWSSLSPGERDGWRAKALELIEEQPADLADLRPTKDEEAGDA